MAGMCAELIGDGYRKRQALGVLTGAGRKSSVKRGSPAGLEVQRAGVKRKRERRPVSSPASSVTRPCGRGARFFSCGGGRSELYLRCVMTSLKYRLYCNSAYEFQTKDLRQMAIPVTEQDSSHASNLRATSSGFSS